MANREDEIQNSQFDDSIITRTLGERSGYVFEGYEIWQDFPWFGVGYGNYIYYSYSRSYRNHVEYMSQLSEGGIFGILLYLYFLFVIYKRSIGGFFKKDLLTVKNTLL